jgi:hypothetical protein
MAYPARKRAGQAIRDKQKVVLSVLPSVGQSAPLFASCCYPLRASATILSCFNYHFPHNYPNKKSLIQPLLH